MSIKTKITQLFAKAESGHHIGLAFRQDALAYCLLSTDGSVEHQQIPITDNEQEPAIKQLVSQDNLSSQGHVVLAPTQYQIVQVDKPNVPEEEVLGALKWQIKELVTYPPEDMVLDYFTGPTLAGGAEKVNVVCASKDNLKSMVQLFEDSDITLKTITTEEFAFASLVPFQEHAVLLLCQQPNEEIIILIVKMGRIYFHRRLRGYAQIATKTIEELSFGAIDSLSLEIQRSSDYFERQLKQAPIKEIQLILPIKNEQFIATKLAENTNTPVGVYPFDVLHQDKAMFGAAIGATQVDKLEVATHD
ncbi:type IV pilus biogenesis protein PilM [Thalassotalea euphylliae]|uniref:type IV pilus biogenesis protein PilM n=1 Tax=Thalassotalea euphylliae TaxID=1655234 RepID=UPI0036356940